MRAIITRLLLGIVLATAVFTRAPAQVLVWSTGNSQTSTQGVANWLQASGRFSAVTAYDGTNLTLEALLGYQEVLFFTNGNGDSTASGNLLAAYAETGRRLVVATFAYANQGGNTLAGRFIDEQISPVVFNNSTLYSTATFTNTSADPLLAGVSSITGFYRDSVVPTSGATVVASWSDGNPLLVTKGNVVAITLFPDDGSASVSGDYRLLFTNALAVGVVPEPSTYVLFALGLAAIAWLRCRRR